MKIALTQLNYCIGDFEGNTTKIIKSARETKGADLVVFFGTVDLWLFPRRLP